MQAIINNAKVLPSKFQTNVSKKKSYLHQASLLSHIWTEWVMLGKEKQLLHLYTGTYSNLKVLKLLVLFQFHTGNSQDAYKN